MSTSVKGVDTSGCAYITGYTESTNFPTTSGAYNETINGDTTVSIDADGGAFQFYSDGSDFHEW